MDSPHVYVKKNYKKDGFGIKSTHEVWYAIKQGDQNQTKYYWTPVENVRYEFHKDAVCCFEQILEAAPYKTAVVRPFTFHLAKHPKEDKPAMLVFSEEARTNWWAILFTWNPTHGHTNVCRLTKAYVSSLRKVGAVWKTYQERLLIATNGRK